MILGTFTKALGVLKTAHKIRFFPGYCAVCGGRSLFWKAKDNASFRETFKCLSCASNSRNRHLAKVLCEVSGMKGYGLRKFAAGFPEMKIYECQSWGAIHRVLKGMEGYVCSEFCPGMKPGSVSRPGVRCEDLQKLSFADESFDMVITQDVLEHVRDHAAAFNEIRRVLKPSGLHIFTVPFHTGKRTQSRIKPDGDRDISVLPEEFHGDRSGKVIVYTDFGYDLCEHLGRYGFSTRIWRSEDEDNDLYRIYSNAVFVSSREDGRRK